MNDPVVRKPRYSIGVTRVELADDAGLDSFGGKWVTTCEAHSTVVNSRTKVNALSVRTQDFCEACMDAVTQAARVAMTPPGTR